MKRLSIPLTCGKKAFIDSTDAFVLGWKWQFKPWSNKCGKGYAVHAIRDSLRKTYTIALHHVLIGRSLDKSMVVDHVNGDPLDNRRENLRFVSQRENSINTSRRRKGTYASHYPGTYHHVDGGWVARAQVKGRQRHIGYFQEEVDAATAYFLVTGKY